MFELTSKYSSIVSSIFGLNNWFGGDVIYDGSFFSVVPSEGWIFPSLSPSSFVLYNHRLALTLDLRIFFHLSHLSNWFVNKLMCTRNVCQSERISSESSLTFMVFRGQGWRRRRWVSYSLKRRQVCETRCYVRIGYKKYTRALLMLAGFRVVTVVIKEGETRK